MCTVIERRRKILCIDDDRETASLICEELIDRGFEVRAAFNGREGLGAILEDPPDLVLSDVMLPGRSGTDLIRHLRAYAGTQNLPVIAVTTLADEESETSLRSAGFTAIIPKPINPERFATQVAGWLK